MGEIKHVSMDTPIERILEILDEDAGLIIDNFLSDQNLESIKNDLKPYLNVTRNGQDEFTGFETKRVGALMARSKTCQDLALDPLINQMADSFLGPHCESYQLHFTSAIQIGPGESSQILHRDRGVWGGYIPRKIETQFSTVWAINDFTKENGATQVVPGSHKWHKDREPLPEEIAYAEMKAGSVFIYTGSVLHGGGTNVTEQPRLGVFLHYAPSWLRQEENQYLSCPPEVAKDFSPELRSLIGYSKGGYVLGFFTDPEDKEGRLESVSPEKIFGESKDQYESLATPENLVKESTRK
jgi:ectoine hydroxylase-related dioxygenase (phytanoyl-CoA dioxygenase family)|tara:strand:+ start:3095 stop:3985 length:891 start_codon:yes stop_codon:yes gene_type:complete